MTHNLLLITIVYSFSQFSLVAWSIIVLQSVLSPRCALHNDLCVLSCISAHCVMSGLYIAMQ